LSKSKKIGKFGFWKIWFLENFTLSKKVLAHCAPKKESTATPGWGVRHKMACVNQKLALSNEAPRGVIEKTIILALLSKNPRGNLLYMRTSSAWHNYLASSE
jgi:hypothetical protein